MVGHTDTDLVVLDGGMGKQLEASGAPFRLNLALADNPRGIRTGAYANAFVPKPESYAANEVILGRRDELTADAYEHIASDWVEGGASIVGGCCHMFPEHIEALTSLQD